MADQRALYTEEAIGYGHPNKEDVLNRLKLIEHSYEGVHVNTITAKIANYTVTSIQCSGANIFTNNGASGSVTFTLPTAVAGYRVTFVVLAAQLLIIVPGASDTIRIGGSEATTDIRSSTIGANIELVAVNTTEWIAIDQGVTDFTVN